MGVCLSISDGGLMSGKARGRCDVAAGDPQISVRMEISEPHKPPRYETVAARETNRRLFVSLPSGWTCRPYKFPRGADLSRPLSMTHEVTLGLSEYRRYVLTWNPADYRIPAPPSFGLRKPWKSSAVSARRRRVRTPLVETQ
jgi:hypothetical protein